MLNAHMDTVGVAGMTDPFEPRLDGRPALRAWLVRHEGKPRGLHARDRRGRSAAGSGAT